MQANNTVLAKCVETGISKRSSGYGKKIEPLFHADTVGLPCPKKIGCIGNPNTMMM